MSMRFLASFLMVSAVSLFAANPVPRKSGEFVIKMTDGKEMLLSSTKGKVVAVEFLFTTCPHCQDSARLLTRLQTELGPKGFQPVGVAINPMAGMLVPDFVKTYGVKFPVGFAESNDMLKFMGFSPMMRWVVPQMVLIDRTGTIRYQTPVEGDPQLGLETYLRGKIVELLNEKSGAAALPAAAPVKKKAS